MKDKREILINVIGALLFAWLIGVACGYGWCWKALEGGLR